MMIWRIAFIAWLVGRRNEPQTPRSEASGFGYPTVIAFLIIMVTVSAPIGWALTAAPGIGTALNIIWGTIVFGLTGIMAHAVHADRMASRSATIAPQNHS
jgi:hypothetical protein